MKTVSLIVSAVLLAGFAGTTLTMPAQAKSLKECAAEWDQLKANKQTEGKTYREFSKECMSGSSTAAPPPAAPPPAAQAPVPEPKEPKSTKPVSGGRQAMIERERACGKEWKEAKANGTRPAGMKWPQFWSACDKRMKEKGM